MALRSAERGEGTRRLVLAVAAGLVALTTALVAFAPGTAPRPMTSPTVAGPLPDGEMFGFIRRLDSSAVVIDPAWLLVGPKAVAAAIEDGAITVADQLPDEVYVRNRSLEEIHIDLVADPTLVVLIYDDKGGLAEQRVSIGELLAAFDGGPSEHPIYAVDPQAFPVLLDVDNGAVVGFRQPYLPPGVVVGAASPLAAADVVHLALPH